MKKIFVVMAAVLLFAGPVLAANMAAEAIGAAPMGNEQQAFGGTVWAGPEGTVLFDNGPLITCPGCGSGGADVSSLQDQSLGMTIYGFGHQLSADNRVADDFTVPAGETWDIGTITFFAYQSFAGNVSTITAVNLQIWDGDPSDAGSSVIFGDTTTNRMSATSWTGIYRTLEGDIATNTDRAIMANVVDVNTSLGEGTYWLDWQTDGTATSGPWAPPVTILGQNVTGNALQEQAGAPWIDLLDVADPQGLPFIISTGGGSNITLEISGTCPGPVTITAMGATPNAGVGILSAGGLGNGVLGGGPCAGTMTGLDAPAFFNIIPTNGNGDAMFNGNAPANICGRQLQVIDANGCVLSNTAQL